MFESLAIISGKGGSGKTILAISLAQLFASCGKRVLLVDCDMSTHGATYFFENMLSEKNKYCTFSEILFGDYEPNKEILRAAYNIQFVPSHVEFPAKLLNKSIVDNDDYNIDIIISWITEREKCDIVIYDCQAGYSIATNLVTRYSKKKLAVVEADAISTSSLRVLYSQLSEQLDAGITYQVFNKVSKEEQDSYSKVIFGTLFTNLTPILFDWNVRRAFLTNDLPNIGASTPILTNSIYNLAISLSTPYKDELQGFITGVKVKLLDKVENKLNQSRYERRKLFLEQSPIFIACLSTIGLAIVSILRLVDRFDTTLYESVLNALIVLMLAVAFPMMLFVNRKRIFKDVLDQSKLRKERDDLKDEIDQLITQKKNVQKLQETTKQNPDIVKKVQEV